ncbi:MAG: response regulator transcription factor [Deltaproteobacteria bacterium]|nr:response regulator transcription factor [Deltaproteobacteria bacterium]
MTLRVLVIDDDARLFALLAEYLATSDVDAEHAPGGAEGLERLAGGGFDAVVLDVMMPGMSGLDVLRKLRERSAVPVVMLTARGDETDRVVGLELGADDYLPKPFSPRELVARLRAVLRRTQPSAEGVHLSAEGIEVEVATRTVRVRGAPVELTGVELDLLVALMRRPGRVVPRAALLELAGRGDTQVNDRTVDVHVSHLRRKLGDDPKTPRLLKTVRGVGYVFAGRG